MLLSRSFRLTSARTPTVIIASGIVSFVTPVLERRRQVSARACPAVPVPTAPPLGNRPWGHHLAPALEPAPPLSQRPSCSVASRRARHARFVSLRAVWSPQEPGLSPASSARSSWPTHHRRVRNQHPQGTPRQASHVNRSCTSPRFTRPPRPSRSRFALPIPFGLPVGHVGAPPGCRYGRARNKRPSLRAASPRPTHPSTPPAGPERTNALAPPPPGRRRGAVPGRWASGARTRPRHGKLRPRAPRVGSRG